MDLVSQARRMRNVTEPIAAGGGYPVSPKNLQVSG